MEYKGIIKKRKTWLTVLFVILACLMLWRTIVTQHWSYLPIVILVILACFFTKEQIISRDGVDIQYTLFDRWTMHNLWTWDEITSLLCHCYGSKPSDSSGSTGYKYPFTFEIQHRTPRLN